MESDTEIRVLLITGAGQDLSERTLARTEVNFGVGSTLETDYNPLLRRMRRLPFPVICAVNGVAAGAGCNFALACDLVIAAKSASFIEAFSRIGLIADAGGIYVLPRLIGTARAMALCMLAEPVSAEQAEAWGLIWKCMPDDKLQEEVQALVQRLSAAPTRALSLLKKAIYASPQNNYETQLGLEARLQSEAGQTSDFKEGVSAFLEKRPARFSGN